MSYRAIVVSIVASLSFSSWLPAEIRMVAEDYEAALILASDHKTKVGEAKWKAYSAEDTQFSIMVNSQAFHFKDPFSVYLNDKLVGQTSRETFVKAEKIYEFHRFKLETKNGSVVPAVKEGDVVKLVNPEKLTILGRFVPD